MTEIPSNRKTLLVIENDDTTREGVAGMLTREGWQVVAVPDGRDALDHLLSGNRPDLIFMDMYSPVLDGWRFLEELEHWPTGQRPPIIVTAGAILSREWAEAHRCCGFLRKPYTREELLTEIRRCLECPCS